MRAPSVAGGHPTLPTRQLSTISCVRMDSIRFFRAKQLGRIDLRVKGGMVAPDHTMFTI